MGVVTCMKDELLEALSTLKAMSILMSVCLSVNLMMGTLKW